jgi:hypothetical protein
MESDILTDIMEHSLNPASVKREAVKTLLALKGGLDLKTPHLG